MSVYSDIIIKATGCMPDEADAIEDSMRHTIFHSTLDWQTRSQLAAGAREANEIRKYLIRNFPADVLGIERDKP